MNEEQLEELKNDVKDVVGWFNELGGQLKEFTEVYNFLENIDVRNPEDIDKLYAYFPEDIDKADLDKIKLIMEEDDEEAVQAEEALKAIIQQMLSGINEIKTAIEREIKFEKNIN